MPLDRSGKMSLARLESSYWIEEDSEEFGMDTQTPKCKCWLWNFYSSRVCVRYFSPHSSSSMFAISPLTDKPPPPPQASALCECVHTHASQRAGGRTEVMCVPRDSVALCTLLGVLSYLWVKKRKKEKTDMLFITPTRLISRRN